jgi:hypothetical protein
MYSLMKMMWTTRDRLGASSRFHEQIAQVASTGWAAHRAVPATDPDAIAWERMIQAFHVDTLCAHCNGSYLLASHFEQADLA